MTATTSTPVERRDDKSAIRPDVEAGDSAPAPRPADPRRTALFRFALSISVLTIVGHLFLGFEQSPVTPVVAVLVAYTAAFLFETLDAWAWNRRAEYRGDRSDVFFFLLPHHIAALACALLLYSSSLVPYLFATVAAVASKYLIRIRSGGRLRHFLNPSNFGISVTLLTMPLVGFVPPYMFLNNTDHALDVLIPLGVLMAGTLLNAGLTKKMPLIMGWVGGYVLQAVLRTVFFDDVLTSTLGMMTGVAFVLFTNYMITDPGTTPTGRWQQVTFGVTTAIVYGSLIVLQVSFAIFFALIIVCAMRGILMMAGERRVRAS